MRCLILFLWGLLVATVGATAGALAAGTADPAIFVARSATATVYLLGTVHVLPPGLNWHSAGVNHAIAEAGELWLEVADVGDATEGVRLVQRYGLEQGGPWTGKLSPDDLAALDAAARTFNPQAGAAGFNLFRPWVVIMQLAALSSEHAGFDLKSGVDLALANAFHAAGKPVKGIETADEQVRIFAEMSENEQLAGLHDALKDFAGAKDQLDAMLAAWTKGDIAALGEVAARDSMAADPVLYGRLVIARNHRMAEAIRARLAGQGVALFAVGALHLAGRDGVPELLKAAGVEVRRQ